MFFSLVLSKEYGKSFPFCGAMSQKNPVRHFHFIDDLLIREKYYVLEAFRE